MYKLLIEEDRYSSARRNDERRGPFLTNIDLILLWCISCEWRGHVPIVPDETAKDEAFKQNMIFIHFTKDNWWLSSAWDVLWPVTWHQSANCARVGFFGVVLWAYCTCDTMDCRALVVIALIVACNFIDFVPAGDLVSTRQVLSVMNKVQRRARTVKLGSDEWDFFKLFFITVQCSHSALSCIVLSSGFSLVLYCTFQWFQPCLALYFPVVSALQSPFLSHNLSRLSLVSCFWMSRCPICFLLFPSFYQKSKPEMTASVPKNKIRNCSRGVVSNPKQGDC